MDPRIHMGLQILMDPQILVVDTADAKPSGYVYPDFKVLSFS